MTPSFGRAAVSLILAPAIALAAVLAPEHLHEADADHHHSAVHRHLQPHSVASHDGDHAELADDDGHVVWLDSNVALNQIAYQFAPPIPPPAPRFQLVAAVVERSSPPDYDTAPPHGPPRACLSPRAPPYPSV